MHSCRMSAKNKRASYQRQQSTEKANRKEEGKHENEKKMSGKMNEKKTK